MRLLALDLGTRCGWAHFVAGQRMSSGTWVLDKDRQYSRGELFCRHVRDFVISNRIEILAYEDAPRGVHQGVHAARLFGGWLMLLEIVQRRTSVEILRVNPNTVRSAAGVKREQGQSKSGLTEAERRHAAHVRRKRNKAAIIDAARALGWDVGDDNEADACFVGLAALTGRASKD